MTILAVAITPNSGAQWRTILAVEVRIPCLWLAVIVFIQAIDDLVVVDVPDIGLPVAIRVKRCTAMVMSNS
jgi:hypothetical protein